MWPLVVFMRRAGWDADVQSSLSGNPATFRRGVSWSAAGVACGYIRCVVRAGRIT